MEHSDRPLPAKLGHLHSFKSFEIHPHRLRMAGGSKNRLNSGHCDRWIAPSVATTAKARSSGNPSSIDLLPLSLFKMLLKANLLVALWIYEICRHFFVWSQSRRALWHSEVVKKQNTCSFYRLHKSSCSIPYCASVVNVNAPSWLPAVQAVPVLAGF